jgi:nitrogen fixation NifU-like protein
MDHYRSPRHRSPVPDPDIESHELNPFCGDEVTLQIKINDEGMVTAVSSVSQGCSIVQASASMMAELMEGKTLEQLMGLSRRFRSFMQGDPVEEGKVAGLGDLEALQVVRQYPVRIKCVLLPWLALEEGIEQASS